MRYYAPLSHPAVGQRGSLVIELRILTDVNRIQIKG